MHQLIIFLSRYYLHKTSISVWWIWVNIYNHNYHSQDTESFLILKSFLMALYNFLSAHSLCKQFLIWLQSLEYAFSRSSYGKGFIQCINLCVCFLSAAKCLRFIHVEWINVLFFPIAEKCSIERIYHNLSIYQLMNIWIASSLEVSCIILLWTPMYTSLYGYICSFLLYE